MLNGFLETEGIWDYFLRLYAFLHISKLVTHNLIYMYI